MNIPCKNSNRSQFCGKNKAFNWHLTRSLQGGQLFSSFFSFFCCFHVLFSPTVSICCSIIAKEPIFYIYTIAMRVCCAQPELPFLFYANEWFASQWAGTRWHTPNVGWFVGWNNTLFVRHCIETQKKIRFSSEIVIASFFKLNSFTLTACGRENGR